ncbi:aminopeptidase N [Phycicoccus endophyticus]|uniref:Aminopeptidase N n=1 Tax=Phycicoccus endophyticus TaxID=1690220 RepID=A0A7G9QZE1_9MICO|nr:aminopeptidase N [Phycicoccus endophyticus]NHI19074.1 aminopeptidase N [Phycicoccus endophyticus]QNN48716.1 aminopeptidase N [Phycicoccus endophyticus]
MPSLTHDEALSRAALVAVEAMEVDLDLDRGPEVFGSRTTITFTCRRPGESTVVDLRPQALHSVRLNGRELQDVLVDGRLRLADLAADNVLEVEATMSYGHDGQGLHRSSDPADGEDYVYGHLFLDAAPRVFACFDQPDLKAPYTVGVRAPEHWSVLGNGGATQVAPGRWELARTAPLATYFVTVCAGPWASVTAEHDGVPLGIHARRSLERPLREQAEHMLATTRTCLDHYHRLFGIRYPFGEYHQVFVPEFNAGAMENPGCVTFRDAYVFRGAASPDQVLERDNTIAHEMAHMWFGDLVTMRWWDDLWLNESFAEYMAYRTSAEALGAPQSWVSFGIVRKLWGYAAERAPSTHPVAGSPAPDALSALQNFDGISYAKGASVLRQLIAHIGDEAFLAGVRDYLRGHAYGNGELAEFLAAMAAAAGEDLGPWAGAWLRTAGADRLELTRTGTLTRRTPEEHPADRPHTLDVAAFDHGREALREDVVLTGERAEVPGVAGLPEGALVVPNAGDLTWAEVALDPGTVAALVDGLADVPDPVARTVVWTSLLGGMHRGEVDPRVVVDVLESAWPREDDAAVLSRVALVVTGTVVPLFLPPAEQAEAMERVAHAADALGQRARGASGPAARAWGLLAARVGARALRDEARLHRWAAGADLPPELAGDDDFRWLVLRRLAALDALEEAELEAAQEADRSLAGRLAALGVRAARPTPQAKEWAWSTLAKDPELSNYGALEVARGFWVAEDPAVVRPYVGRVGDLLARLEPRMGEDALSRVATALHPKWLVEPATLAASSELLAREDLSPGVHRALLDEDHVLREVLESRRRFG